MAWASIQWIWNQKSAIYVTSCCLLSLSLPIIPTNPKLLILAFVACLGAPLIVRGFREVYPWGWYATVPLIALCAWIAVQTPLTASEPVLLFGPKEAVGLATSFWLMLAIPGLSSSPDGWKAIRVSLSIVTVIVFLGILVSYCGGVGERHQTGADSYRAYFYYSDAIGVTVAFLLLWHAVQRNVVLAILAATTLLMMLGKSALALLMLMTLVFFLSGIPRLRRASILVMFTMLVGSLVVVGLARVPSMADEQFSRLGLQSETARRQPVVREEVKACIQRAVASESFLLRAECAAISAQGYPGPSVLNSGINTLSRRAVGVLAGLYIVGDRPLLGVGYHQSWRLVERMPELNPFRINDQFARPGVLWYRVGQVRNTWARAAAEFGVPGVLLLFGFALGLARIAIRVFAQFRRNDESRRIEPVVAALWIIVFLICAQTDPWLLPGSIPTVWLGIIAGLMLSGVGRTYGPSETRLNERIP